MRRQRLLKVMPEVAETVFALKVSAGESAAHEVFEQVNTRTVGLLQKLHILKKMMISMMMGEK